MDNYIVVLGGISFFYITYSLCRSIAVNKKLNSVKKTIEVNTR